MDYITSYRIANRKDISNVSICPYISGQLIFCEDTREIWFDFHNKRIRYGQSSDSSKVVGLTVVATDSERIALKANSLYYVTDTNSLWIRNSAIIGNWYLITGQGYAKLDQVTNLVNLKINDLSAKVISKIDGISAVVKENSKKINSIYNDIDTIKNRCDLFSTIENTNAAIDAAKENILNDVNILLSGYVVKDELQNKVESIFDELMDNVLPDGFNAKLAYSYFWNKDDEVDINVHID